MKTHENSPDDWIRSASIRLRSTDHLIEAEGVTESAVELLQESAERFLKAYLIANGWKLAKIHDLGALLAEAIKLNPDFAQFEEFADSLTDQFWAQHSRVGI